MILGEKWKIYWENYMLDAYTYGTEVEFKAKDCVEVNNNLVPSGTIMKTWYSRTNFQSNRCEPTLPIIDGEGKYLLRYNIDMDYPEGVLLRLVYYDKYDEEVGNQIIRKNNHIFRCPMATYSYRLQLINMGSRRIVFHSMSIQEVLSESET